MTDDMPLHWLDLPDERWWACERPEAPYVMHHTMFDTRCEPCRVAIRTAYELGLLGGRQVITHVRNGRTVKTPVDVERFLRTRGILPVST